MDMNLILASIGVFLGIILLLVVILLVAKQYLTPSGKVKITINISAVNNNRIIGVWVAR